MGAPEVEDQACGGEIVILSAGFAFGVMLPQHLQEIAIVVGPQRCWTG
jgi:hypothetical protein